MNPLPVAVWATSAAPPAAELLAGLKFIGFEITWSIRNADVACGTDPHKPTYAGIGSTQKMSVNVRKLLLPSSVLPAGVLVKLESFRMPHEARMLLLKGTTTLWLTSMTESTFPAVAPQ